MQPVLIGIAFYIVVQFAIGIIVSRKIASESDKLIAGRNLGVGLAAFSILATWFGAETIVGAAGSIYANGLSAGSADPFGYGLCLIILWLVIAQPPWWRKYTTFGDLFRERYGVGVNGRNLRARSDGVSAFGSAGIFIVGMFAVRSRRRGGERLGGARHRHGRLGRGQPARVARSLRRGARGVFGRRGRSPPRARGLGAVPFPTLR
jgi:Na+/proline symporter